MKIEPMLLTLILTYGAGPVLRIDFLSHFLAFVWEKIEVLVSMYIFEINMRKLMIALTACRTGVQYMQCVAQHTVHLLNMSYTR